MSFSHFLQYTPAEDTLTQTCSEPFLRSFFVAVVFVRSSFFWSAQWRPEVLELRRLSEGVVIIDNAFPSPFSFRLLRCFLLFSLLIVTFHDCFSLFPLNPNRKNFEEFFPRVRMIASRDTPFMMAWSL